MKLAIVCLAAAAPFAVEARTVSVSEDSNIKEIVITATRLQASAFDVPAAISSVPAEQLRYDALGVNLADHVASVPGLLARNRNNYAQDQQISIRGIGANSAFGIRGVRVYQDGLPATGPDGQGQVSQFNLDSAERVEILRGPFSALYGNSSGGVIQLFTADGKAPAELRSWRGLRQLRNLPRRRECERLHRSARLQPAISRTSPWMATATTAARATNPSTARSTTPSTTTTVSRSSRTSCRGRTRTIRSVSLPRSSMRTRIRRLPSPRSSTRARA